MSAKAAPHAGHVPRQPAIVQALEPDTTPAVAPGPVKAAPLPRRPVDTAPRGAPASKKAEASKSGPPVGLIAGAAVAAITVIAAGVSIFVSGKKSTKPPVKKQLSKRSAPARPTKSTSTKASSRASSSGSTRPAGTRSSTTPRRTSSGGSRPSSRASSSAAASAAASPTTATSVRKASPKVASAAAASPKPPSAAASPKPPAAPAAEKPKTTAAAAAAEKSKPAGTIAGAGNALAAAAAPVAQSAPLEAAPASQPPAAAAVSEAADEAADVPAAPATPAPAATPAAAAAGSETTPTASGAQQQQEQEPEQQQQEAAVEPAAQPAAAAEPSAASVQPAAQPAAAAAEPAAAAAKEEAVPDPATEEADVAEALEDQAAAGAAATEQSAAASASEEPVIEEPAAASPSAAAEEPEGEDTAANDVQPDEGDEGLIELAEGETLPVVDEAGNQLGTLHADGRVLDDKGVEIGALDEDGNVVLYEQQQGEEPVLSAVEEEAEQLMRQAAVAWNVQNNRDAAEKFQRKALEVITQEAGGARPEIIAEVASSLADMLYARDKQNDAKDALQVALDAAEAAGQNALYVKLSNNMGAVLRKQNLHEEGKALHQKAMQVAVDKFGIAHATTTLARGNLVDALDQLGERDAARTLLKDSITQIKQVAEEKESEEAAKGGKPTEQDTAAAVAAALKSGQTTELAAMLAVDSSRAYTAAVRVQIELARLEMKDKQFTRAAEVLESALNMANTKFGEETAEASSVLAALATCHRQAGNLDTCVSLFERLYDINERQSGGSAANQSGIMLAKTLSDVFQESERNAEALQWSEKALSLMQQLAGVKVHPALEPYFNEVIELRNKTGDEAGADELRKQLLKAKAQMVGQAARTGPNSKAAAGKPPSGQSSGKAGAAGKQKKGTKKK